MNKVFLIGRLTKEPLIKTIDDKDTKIARYTLAVDRRYKKEGEVAADFISCTVFGKGAEFAEKYLHKGSKIAVVGRIQTGSYDKDGQRVYTTDVIVEEQEFAESKGSAGYKPDPGDGFVNLPEDVEVPFF